MNDKKTKAKKAVGVAAFGYFLHGPNGEANKKKIKAWTIKAKGEVLEQFEKKKEITEEQYKEIVDKITTKYSKLKTVGEIEAVKLNKELKKHWKAIKTNIEEDQTKKK
jgi:hypothetical protein